MFKQKGNSYAQQGEQIPQNKQQMSVDQLNMVFAEFMKTLPEKEQKVLTEQIKQMNDEQKMELANRMLQVLQEKQAQTQEESQGQEIPMPVEGDSEAFQIYK